MFREDLLRVRDDEVWGVERGALGHAGRGGAGRGGYPPFQMGIGSAAAVVERGQARRMAAAIFKWSSNGVATRNIKNNKSFRNDLSKRCRKDVDVAKIDGSNE